MAWPSHLPSRTADNRLGVKSEEQVTIWPFLVSIGPWASHMSSLDPSFL